MPSSTFSWPALPRRYQKLRGENKRKRTSVTGQWYAVLTKQFPLLGFLLEFNKRREAGWHSYKKWTPMSKPHRPESAEPRTTDCPGLGGHFRASTAYQGSTAHRRMASGRVMMDASSEAAF